MREDSTDYFSTLADVIARLDHNTPAIRRAIYDRARQLLNEHARFADPPWDLFELVHEQRALEEAIQEVEVENCLLEASRRPPPRITHAPPRRAAIAGPHEPERRSRIVRWILIGGTLALLAILAAVVLIAYRADFMSFSVSESQQRVAREAIERGDVRTRAGEFDQAIAEYGQAIRLNPRDVAGFNNRAYAHWRKGETDRAISDYSAAIRLEPENVVALGNRGVAYNRKGEYVRAIRDLDEVIRLQPENAYAWNSRCWGRALSGKLQAALADCHEALRRRPDDPNFLDSRGLAYLKSGRFDDAIVDYNAALLKDAKLAGALYGRGIAKTRKGDRIGGAADIDAATAINPGIAEEFAHYGLR